ncbi:peptidase M56, partial [Caulobacter sp. D4A]
MLVDLLALTLLRVQFAAAAGVLLVLALRVPVRRLVGPEAVYKLWRLAPVAALVSIFPSLSEALKAGAAAQPPERLLAVAMLTVWVVGVVGLA